MEYHTTLPLIIGIAALLLGVILFLVARAQRGASGLPTGQVAYSDTGAWGRVEKPLFDPVLRLTGKPDYLVKKDGEVIPVEVKSGEAPKAPYESHVHQLAAYCLLLERTTGTRPTHGIVHYQDRDFVIEYTTSLENDLKNVIQSIRDSEHLADVPCSHNSKPRCLACGFRAVCEQRLA